MGKILDDKVSHVLHVFAELYEKIIEKFSVKVFAHLIENEPIPDGAVSDETLDQIQVFTSFEISERIFRGLFKNIEFQ